MGKRSREKKERRERGEIVPKKEKAEIRPVAICRGIILFGTFLILFTPFVISDKFFFPFVGPKSIYFMGLVEIIFAAYLLLLLFDSKYRPRVNIFLLTLVVFLVILILSSVFGADPTRSFWSKYERMTGLLMFFHLMVFFVVLSSVFKKRKEWFKIFTVSIFAASLMGILSLLIKINVNILGGIGSATQGGATLGNSSFLGTYLLFNLFLTLYVLLRSTGNLRIYSAVTLAIISLSLLFSDARAAIISVLGGLILLFLIWLIASKKGKLKSVGIAFLVIYVIAVLGIMFFIFQPDSSVYRFIWEKISTKGRLVVWEIGWQGWLERPLLGWGPENYEIVFTQHFDPRLFIQEYGTEVWFDRAHNIILDTLTSTGIIGLISYLGIFVSIFFVLWKKYFLRKLNFWVVGIISVMLVAYFVQNLTVFDMINSYMMFFLVLAFIGSIISRKPEENSEQGAPQNFVPQKFNFFRSLTAIIILVFFGISFFNFVVKPVKADSLVIDSLRTMPATDEKIALYKETLEASSIGKYQIREIFADSILNFPQTEAAQEASFEKFKLELDFLEAELRKSTEESPLDYRSHLKLGHLYNLYNQLGISKVAEAEEILTRAIELSPDNQQGYWALAQAKLYGGDFDTAFSLVEKTVELEPRLDRSHLILIQVALFKGDRALAEEKAAEALEINPEWEAQINSILNQQT